MCKEFVDITYDDIRNIYEANEMLYEESEKYTKRIKEKGGFDERIDFFQMHKFKNFFIETPYGNIIMEGCKDEFYRGEKRIYPTNKSSLLRVLEKFKNNDDKEAYKLIANMRIYEFMRFLNQFECTKNWSKETRATILYDVLAQHYGLETYWLDITTHFIVALFFATCTYDEKTKKWRPLSKEEIEEYKYGIIYQKKIVGASVINNHKIMQNERDAIYPIGKQAFRRCESQSAYAMRCEEEVILTESGFRRLRFKHSEKLSNDVYEFMKCGEGIYPNEGIELFDEEINKIKNLEEFSKEAFEYAFEDNLYFKSYEDAEKAISNLKEYNIKIIEGMDVISVSEEQRKEFEKRYDEKIKKDLEEGCLGLRTEYL